MFLFAAALCACSPPQQHADDGAMTCDSAPTIECRNGESAGSCDTATTSPVCLDGIWGCPPGAVEPAMCACFLGAEGVCPDGATGDASDP
jgi:hypothetical protein